MLSELFTAFRGGDVDFISIVIQLLAYVVIIFLVLPFHEWAHAFTAMKLGDTTVKYRGRLSLNPLAHIDVIGSLCLILFGFGWAKPVPVNPRNFKNEKVGMAITAVMGPVANLVAALAGAIILCGLVTFVPNIILNNVGVYFLKFLNFYVTVNVALAVFNLIPIPPLDGSKVLFVFLPNKAVNFFYQYEQFIMMGMFVLLWTGFLSGPLSLLSGYLSDAVYFVASLPYFWV
ncbi:MAG: site-2 protease family protein [Ruminococcus sp.]|nr:site-2 protease family protein [Ruminococcus sp.]